MKSRKLNVELQSRVFKLLEKVESATQLNTVIREMQSQWDDVVKNSLVVGDYVNVVEVKKTKTQSILVCFTEYGTNEKSFVHMISSS